MLCTEIILRGLGNVNVRVRFHPVAGHTGPEGEYSFMVSALDEGGWSTRHAPAAFTPGKDPVPIVQEAGCVSGPVWIGAEKSRPHRDSIPGPSSP